MADFEDLKQAWMTEATASNQFQERLDRFINQFTFEIRSAAEGMNLLCTLERAENQPLDYSRAMVLTLKWQENALSIRTIQMPLIITQLGRSGFRLSNSNWSEEVTTPRQGVSAIADFIIRHFQENSAYFNGELDTPSMLN